MKKKIIPYSTQNINNDDIRKVVKTLQADLITTGPLLIEFEQLVSKYVNGKYSVAVNSATSGLHIACLSLGLKSGDILWTVPNTFVASANCAIYCGAKVDFVDINPNTFPAFPSGVTALTIMSRAGRTSPSSQPIMAKQHRMTTWWSSLLAIKIVTIAENPNATAAIRSCRSVLSTRKPPQRTPRTPAVANVVRAAPAAIKGVP